MPLGGIYDQPPYSSGEPDGQEDSPGEGLVGLLRKITNQLTRMEQRWGELERTLQHCLQGVRWRATSARWITQDGTSTGSVHHDVADLFGSIPAQSIEVVRLNGATVEVTLNGEQRSIPLNAVGDGVEDETIHSIDLNVTGAGTGDVELRATAYTGPGA